MSTLEKWRRLDLGKLVWIAVFVACTTKEAGNDAGKPTDTGNTVGSGEAVVLGTSRAHQGLIGPPGGDRDSTIEYMTKHVDFGNDVKTDSGFVDYFDCTSCTKPQVQLMVMPEKKANKVDWPTALVNREHEGWVVAKVVNVDPDKVEYVPLKLKPDSTVFQWVGPISNDGRETAVAWYKIDVGTGAAELLYSQTNITYCDDPDWKKRKHGVAMRHHPTANGPCVKRGYTPPNSTSSPQIKPLFPPGGTWISCAGGCCEVSDLTGQ